MLLLCYNNVISFNEDKNMAIEKNTSKQNDTIAEKPLKSGGIEERLFKTQNEIDSQLLRDRFLSVAMEKTGKADIEINATYSELDLDSLLTVVLIMAWEEEFQISIPNEDAEGFTTLQQTFDYIERAVMAKSGDDLKEHRL